MAWPETLRLEVEVEFQRLAPKPFYRVEEALYQAQFRERTRQAERDRWRRHTPSWRAYNRKYMRERDERLKTVVVAVRACKGCGKPFAITSYRRMRGHETACSPGCQARLRKCLRPMTIGGKTMLLTEWCARQGIKVTTAFMRIKRGWSVERALGFTSREGRVL